MGNAFVLIRAGDACAAAEKQQQAVGERKGFTSELTLFCTATWIVLDLPLASLAR
jgi:hypothetical protein